MRAPGLDFLRLCSASEQLQGRIPAVELPRLSDALAGPAGQVVYEYRFARDAAGRCFVDGTLSAQVSLVCQRCMKPADFDLSSRCSAQLAWSDEDEEQVARDREPLRIPEEGLTLQDLVDEDGVFMLPFAPRCENQDSCGNWSPEPLAEPDPPAQENKEPGPFAALAALKEQD